MSSLVNENPVGGSPARRGIQSVEIAYRVLEALKDATQAVPLREIAERAGLTPSAANNYLVSLVRTGLATPDQRAGCYRLGPSALALGMSALQQIDGFESVRREVTALRDTTSRSVALAAWSQAGPMSIFKQDGEHRGPFEMRTGLIPLLSTAAGKVFMACLPQTETLPLIKRELAGTGVRARADEVIAQAKKELFERGYIAITRDHASGYASMAAPIWDWHGDMRFSISLIGSSETLDVSAGSEHVALLLASAKRATESIGGHPPPRNISQAASA